MLGTQSELRIWSPQLLLVKWTVSSLQKQVLTPSKPAEARDMSEQYLWMQRSHSGLEQRWAIPADLSNSIGFPQAVLLLSFS